MWMSAPCAEHAALRLFGDRVPAHVLSVAETARPLQHAAVLATLLGLLRRLDCGVTQPR